MPSIPDDLPRAITGRYRITGVLGRGGRATVYAAHDPLLGRDVAVKVFTARADSAEELRAQEAEARLLAALNHFALTTLFDAGVDASDPARPQIYLVMESIRGGDLKRALADGPLTPVQVAQLGADLADALATVHTAGFLHRDVKPANVLLADRGAESRLRGKLSDFGISTIIGDRQDGDTTTGTAAYLSPEQVEGASATTASDVYALGLVLLEALTATVAFPGTVTESAFARLDRDPTVPDSVPAPIADLLRAMTSREPGLRPTPATVATAFQAVVVDEAVRARAVDPSALVPDEALRLAAVRRFNVLDTPSEETFDRITRLACRLLDVPIAIVSIVDVDREWFKSRRGLPGDLDQIDRDVALCATCVATGRPYALADVRTDPRTSGNPIVLRDPRVQSYAAAPLTTADGYAIGTVCVYDRRERDFDAAALDDLADLGAIVMRELELRLASRRALFGR